MSGSTLPHRFRWPDSLSPQSSIFPSQRFSTMTQAPEAKLFATIDGDRFYTGTIEVAPERLRVRDSEGNESVTWDYFPPDNVVYIFPPEDGMIHPRMTADGFRWEEGAAIIGTASVKLYRQVDAQGFFVADVPVQAILSPIEGQKAVYQWVFPETDGLYDLPVPDGLYRPKLNKDRDAFIEGEHPDNISKQGPIDWGKFSNEYIESDIDEALELGGGIARLNLVISRMPYGSMELLVSSWNRCVDSMPKGFTKAQIGTIGKLFSENNIPVIVDSDGTIAESAATPNEAS